jgi:hypothetical protein
MALKLKVQSAKDEVNKRRSSHLHLSPSAGHRHPRAKRSSKNLKHIQFKTDKKEPEEK